MSVPSIPNQSIKNLNPCLVNCPQTAACNLKRKALGWKTLQIISAVALGAIMCAVLALSISSIFIPAVPLCCMILSTLPLQYGLSKFNTKRIENLRLEETERGVSQELEKIKDWDQAKIQNFLDHHQIASEENKNNSLMLLPGIARYYYYRNLAETTIQNAETVLAQETGEEMRNFNQRFALESLEYKGFPATIKAARMLEILRQPTSTISLEEKRLKTKTIEQRLLDRHFGIPPNDDYVKLEDGSSITFEDIRTIHNQKDPSLLPVQLRGRLFSNSSTLV